MNVGRRMHAVLVSAAILMTARNSLASAPPSASARAVLARAAVVSPPPPTPPLDLVLIGSAVGRPHHGSFQTLAFGGHAELRAADDRIAGISNPDWMSIPRVSAFAMLHVHARLEISAEATYDRATDDLVVERLLADGRLAGNVYAHAGVLQPPLGRVNFDHDAPHNEFDRMSYVATDLIGVPNPQLGAGIHGIRNMTGWTPWTYELDWVTGYDEGVVTKAPLGTRLPMGRNTLGTRSDSWACAGRVAITPSPGSELGFAALGGSYDLRQMDGSVDPAHTIALSVMDGCAQLRGFRISFETGAALIDVPRSLEGLYAQRQWAGAVEVGHTLRAPIFKVWPGTALTAAARADAIDFDAQLAGDSKSRLSTALDIHVEPWSVFRSGWYYELRRDRFNNVKPAAGLAFSLATYF